MMNIAKSKILQLTEKYATSSHINFIVRRIFFFFIIIGTMAMRKHSDKCIFHSLRFGCSFAVANTIKPELL